MTDLRRDDRRAVPADPPRAASGCSIYIIPYPSERQLWPNFLSPLVWDVCAVSTYLTVSIIFWYVGLIPDLAAARDRWELTAGPDHPRTRLYRALALGWSGSGNQWRHYGRGYLFFAALATPLVISVHSVVSWDFAMAQPARLAHDDLRAVLRRRRDPLRPGDGADAADPDAAAAAAGARHDRGPLRGGGADDDRHRAHRRLRLRDRAVHRPGIPATCSSSSSPSGARPAGWRRCFWALPVCNVLAPLAFLWKRVRRSITALLVVSILVNIGMWLERLVIIAGSTSHDFLPHNWHTYAPRPVEISITLGSFAFFLFWFFIFTKLAPTVSISDVKEDQAEGDRALHGTGHRRARRCERLRPRRGGLAGGLRAPRAAAGGAEESARGGLRARSRRIRPSACARRRRSWGAGRARCATGRSPARCAA